MESEIEGEQAQQEAIKQYRLGQFKKALGPTTITTRVKGKKGKYRTITTKAKYDTSELTALQRAGVAVYRSGAAMERGLGTAPRRLARSMQGARKIEKRLRHATAVATGMGGYLFPMTGMQTRMKSKGMARGKAGRPQGVYKHVIPGVGPVHVYTYRKWLRSQKQKANAMMAAREQAMAQKMMKRGLPPQMAYAQAEQLAQLRQQQALQEIQQQAYQPAPQPQQQQYPQHQQIMPQNAPVQARAPINLLGSGRQMQQQVPQGMKPVYDIFTGRTRYEPNRVGAERWAQDQSSISRPGTLGIRKQTQGGYY
jgi:hypothetical protein